MDWNANANRTRDGSGSLLQGGAVMARRARRPAGARARRNARTQPPRGSYSEQPAWCHDIKSSTLINGVVNAGDAANSGCGGETAQNN